MSEFIEKTDEVIEEAPVVEEKPKKKSQKKSKTDDFIARKLLVINSMTNPAKQRSLAERVLKNKKGSK